MRRSGLALWLFKAVVPAILGHWSGRASHALRRWITGADDSHREDDPLALLLGALNRSQLISMLLTLVILVELSRILLSVR
jgi:hypothetical protein